MEIEDDFIEEPPEVAIGLITASLLFLVVCIVVGCFRNVLLLATGVYVS